jgi:hypothetical protein
MMVMFMIMIHFIGYIPFTIRKIFRYSLVDGLSQTNSIILAYIVSSLLYLSKCVSILIYYNFNKQYRKTFIKMFKNLNRWTK